MKTSKTILNPSVLCALAVLGFSVCFSILVGFQKGMKGNAYPQSTIIMKNILFLELIF